MTDDLPTPGPNEPIPSWPEYEQLREAIHDYLDHDPDDPKWNDIWRALAAIMGEYQRDQFVEAFDLDEPAETTCIRWPITGDDESPTARSKPMTTRQARLTSHQPTTTQHSGSMTANLPSTRCTSIGVTSNGSMPPSRRTTSGLTSSSLPPSGASKSASLRSPSTISAVQVIFYPPERYR